MNEWIIKKYNVKVILNIKSNDFGYIYLIENKINNKKYIGQTINYKRRLNEHLRDMKMGKNLPLYNAMRKYNLSNFIFSIINTASNIKELNDMEIEYIQNYNSNNRKLGYNLESGGKNGIPSKETLLKQSLSHKGIKQNQNWIDNRIAKSGSDDAKKYGKKKTEEDKKYLSENSPKYWLGKTRSDETKKKISETKKKNGFTNIQKEKICKKVYLINVNTNKIIKEYESTQQASEVENVNQSTISRWCMTCKINDDNIWTYSKIITNNKEYFKNLNNGNICTKNTQHTY